MAEDAKHDAKQTAAPKDGRSQEQRIADLELALAQTRAGLPGGTLPDHAAGYLQEIEDTWSMAEQEAARAEADAEPETPPGRP